MLDTQKEAIFITNLLSSKQIFGEFYFVGESIMIEITNGDWKHTHALLNQTMMNAGYLFDYENVTEEDESDCYSAVHVFHKK